MPQKSMPAPVFHNTPLISLALFLTAEFQAPEGEYSHSCLSTDKTENRARQTSSFTQHFDHADYCTVYWHTIKLSQLKYDTDNDKKTHTQNGYNCILS